MDEQTPHGVRVWSDPAWCEQALDWVDERLAETGRRRSGLPGEPRVRPWSAVVEIPTSAGPVWFKATAPGTAFEVGLYVVLERDAPEMTLAPIAADVGRGWLLLPDGGPTLGDRGAGDRLAAVLPAYARFQRRIAPSVDELIAAGVADMRAPTLAARLDEAVGAIGAAETGAQPRDLAGRVEAFRPRVEDWAERLARSPVPASLDHNDLHPWNVLGEDPETFRLYDWGDAVVAHPFASMLVPLGMVRSQLGDVALDDPRYLEIRDAYLAEFGDYAPLPELAIELDLACRLAKIARALTWDRALRAAREQGEELDPMWTDAVRAHLESLFDDSYLVEAG